MLTYGTLFLTHCFHICPGIPEGFFFFGTLFLSVYFTIFLRIPDTLCKMLFLFLLEFQTNFVEHCSSMPYFLICLGILNFSWNAISLSLFFLATMHYGLWTKGIQIEPRKLCTKSAGFIGHFLYNTKSDVHFPNCDKI